MVTDIQKENIIREKLAEGKISPGRAATERRKIDTKHRVGTQDTGGTVERTVTGRYKYTDPITGKIEYAATRDLAISATYSGTQEAIRAAARQEAIKSGRITSGSQIPSPTIRTTTSFGSSDLYQKKFIQSLITSPTTRPSITEYSGVRLPYGQKDITWFEPQFGTISSEYPTGQKEISLIGLMKEEELISPDVSKPSSVIITQAQEKLSKKIIREEKAKAEKILDNTVKDIQKRIDSGELTLKQGEKSLKNMEEISNRKLQNTVKERFNKEFREVLSSVELKKKVSKSEKFRDTLKTSFSPEFQKESRFGKAELGADILAGAISGVAPAVGIGYFAGKGFYKAAKGAKEDIRMVDISPTGKLITPRYMGLIPSAESKEAGLSFLFAATSGIGATTKIGRDITALRKTELMARPWTVTSKELAKVGDETFLSVRGSKVIHGASAEGKALLPVTVSDKGAFKVLGGRGKVDFRVVDFLKEGVVSPKESVLRSSIDYGTFGRGTIKPLKTFGLLDEAAKVYQTSGEGYVSPDMWQNVKLVGKKSKVWSELLGRPYGDTYVKADYFGKTSSSFRFGGVSKKTGEKTIFASGRILKKRLYPTFKGEAFENIPFSKIDIKSAKRLGPEQYARYLESQGKLIYKPYASLGDDFLGVFEHSRIKGITPRIKISKTITSEAERSKTILHELIHYKTPRKLLSGEQFLPYKLRPGEITAFGGEKLPITFKGASKEFIGPTGKVNLFLEESRFTQIFKPQVYGETLSKGGDDILSKGYRSFTGMSGRKSSAKFLKDMWEPSQVTVVEQLSPQVVGEQFAGQTFISGQTFSGQMIIPQVTKIPSVLSVSAVSVKPLIESKVKPQAIVIPKVDVGIKSDTRAIYDLFSATSPAMSSKTDQGITSITKQMSKTSQVYKQAQRPQVSSFFPSTSLLGGIHSGLGLGGKFPLIKWSIPTRKVGAIKKANSWIPQVKSKGKWRNAGKRMDYNSALSRSSKGADLSTARSIRVKPSNKAPQITGLGGWSSRKHKFRPGKKPHTYIEKTKYAIDTQTEKSGLSFAKLSKNMKWGINIKKSKSKKKKSKSPWLF